MEVDIKDPRPNVKLELDLLPENETVVDSIEIADAIMSMSKVIGEIEALLESD